MKYLFVITQIFEKKIIKVSQISKIRLYLYFAIFDQFTVAQANFRLYII